jgi:hypothetical protein
MILNFSKKFDVIKYKSIGIGAIMVETTDTAIYNVYLSPNTCTLQEFEEQLYNIQIDILNTPTNKQLVITGDLNAKHPTWGGNKTNKKGICLLEWMTSLSLTILNDGKKPTCIRHNGTSYIDVTLVNESSLPQSSWEVLEDETMSDHCFTMTRLRNKTCRIHMYIYGATYYCLLNKVFKEYADEPSAEKCKRAIEIAYKKSTPKIRSETDGKLPYWWTYEIQKNIREVKKARRNFQRAKGEDSRDTLQDKYKKLKTILKKSIRFFNQLHIIN